MTINEYKDALKNLIDATDDEQLLQHWKTHLEGEYEQYRQRTGGQQASSADSTRGQGKDDDEGYVVLESGLGIDE